MCSKNLKLHLFYRVNFKFKIRFHKYSLQFTENQSAVHGIILEKRHPYLTNPPHVKETLFP